MFKALDKLSKFFYLGTVIPLFLSLLTPLLVNSRFLFPFITTKTVYFRILVEVALVFYILLILRRPEYRVRLNGLTAAVLIFFGLVTLTSLVGVDLSKSFWGNIERGEGLLTLYHLLTFFLLVGSILQTKKIWFWFLNSYLLVSLGTALYALAQLMGWESLMGFNVIHTTGSRLAATIGNASFYAGYLLFGIFMALWLALNYRQLPVRGVWAKVFRIFYLLILLFEIFILFRTETRGAFLGWLAGLIVFIGLNLIFRSGRSEIKKISFILLLGVILAGSLVWWQRDSQFINQVGILKRLTTISFNDVTTQSRLLTWDSSWQGLQDKAILGYGWENYNVAFNKYFHAEIFRDAGSQIWFDRAHNIIFDIAVSSGLLGLAAYLAVLYMAGRILYQRFRRQGDLLGFSLLSGLLVAYFIQNIFVFDVLATYISFYVFLAWLNNLERLPETEPAADLPVGGQSWGSYWPATAAVLLGLLGLAIYTFNWRPLQANLAGVRALIEQRQGQFQAAADTFLTAIKMNTNQTAELRQRYAELALGLSGQSAVDRDFRVSQLGLAINEIKNNIKEHPLDVQHYLFLMILYNRSNQFNPERSDLALKISQQALMLSPNRPQIYYEIGQALASQGKFDEAVTAFQTAVDLQPAALESHWNLAAMYILAGQQAQAEAEFDWLIEHGFDYYKQENLQRLIQVYSQARNWSALVDIYEVLLEQQPDNINYLIQLAAAYKETGQFTEARATVQKVMVLQPELLSEAESFLQEINQAEGTALPASSD